MSKIEEGNAHICQAEKSLKTTLLKWKPDYEVAADEYAHAATCFRIAKSYKQCRQALLKASDCYKQNRSWFHAAKNLEQILLICRDTGDFSEIPKIAHSSCSLYLQHGSPESGATVLDKAGKMLESTDAEAALPLFQRAAEIVMGEDSPRQAAEYMSKAARILVKLKMYDQAVDAIRQEIGMHQAIEHAPSIGRLTVVLVLVQLARGDQVAAEKAFKEWGNYCEVAEIQTLEMLLQAYDNEDANMARAALNSPFIKHMDVEYSKLARGLPLPVTQEYAIPPVGVRANAAPSYISPNTNNHSGQATVEAEVNHRSTESKEQSSATPSTPVRAAPATPVRAGPATPVRAAPATPVRDVTEKFEEEEEETARTPVDHKSESPVEKSQAEVEDDEYDEGLC